MLVAVGPQVGCDVQHLQDHSGFHKISPDLKWIAFAGLGGVHALDGEITSSIRAESFVEDIVWVVVDEGIRKRDKNVLVSVHDSGTCVMLTWVAEFPENGDGEVFEFQELVEGGCMQFQGARQIFTFSKGCSVLGLFDNPSQIVVVELFNVYIITIRSNSVVIDTVLSLAPVLRTTCEDCEPIHLAGGAFHLSAIFLWTTGKTTTKKWVIAWSLVSGNMAACVSIDGVLQDVMCDHLDVNFCVSSDSRFLVVYTSVGHVVKVCLDVYFQEHPWFCDLQVSRAASRLGGGLEHENATDRCMEIGLLKRQAIEPFSDEGTPWYRKTYQYKRMPPIGVPIWSGFSKDLPLEKPLSNALLRISLGGATPFGVYIFGGETILLTRSMVFVHDNYGHEQNMSISYPDENACYSIVGITRTDYWSLFSGGELYAVWSDVNSPEKVVSHTFLVRGRVAAMRICKLNGWDELSKYIEAVAVSSFLQLDEVESAATCLEKAIGEELDTRQRCFMFALQYIQKCWQHVSMPSLLYSTKQLCLSIMRTAVQQDKSELLRATQTHLNYLQQISFFLNHRGSRLGAGSGSGNPALVFDWESDSWKVVLGERSGTTTSSKERISSFPRVGLPGAVRDAWRHRNVTDIVKEALLSGRISSAIACLMSRKIDFKAFSGSHVKFLDKLDSVQGDYDSTVQLVKRIGRYHAYRLLCNDQMDFMYVAGKMLQNNGDDIGEFFCLVVGDTTRRAVRWRLLKHLWHSYGVSPKDLKAAQTLWTLERLYPSASYCATFRRLETRQLTGDYPIWVGSSRNLQPHHWRQSFPLDFPFSVHALEGDATEDQTERRLELTIQARNQAISAQEASGTGAMQLTQYNRVLHYSYAEEVLEARENILSLETSKQGPQGDMDDFGIRTKEDIASNESSSFGNSGEDAKEPVIEGSRALSTLPEANQTCNICAGDESKQLPSDILRLGEQSWGQGEHLKEDVFWDGYLDLTLNTVKHWTTTTCERVLLEAGHEFAKRKFCDALVYFVEHNNWKAVRDWIRSVPVDFSCFANSDGFIALDMLEHDSNCQFTLEFVMKKETDKQQLSKPIITAIHIAMKKATSFMRELIYLELARHGVHCSLRGEKRFEDVMSALAALGVLFVPSPRTSFHKFFIRYCLLHDLEDVIFDYIDCHNIVHTRDTLLNILESCKIKPNGNLASRLRIHLGDDKSVYEAGINSTGLCKADLVSGAGEILTTLGTLAFSTEIIQQGFIDSLALASQSWSGISNALCTQAFGTDEFKPMGLLSDAHSHNGDISFHSLFNGIVRRGDKIQESNVHAVTKSFQTTLATHTIQAILQHSRRITEGKNLTHLSFVNHVDCAAKEYVSQNETEEFDFRFFLATGRGSQALYLYLSTNRIGDVASLIRKVRKVAFENLERRHVLTACCWFLRNIDVTTDELCVDCMALETILRDHPNAASGGHFQDKMIQLFLAFPDSSKTSEDDGALLTALNLLSEAAWSHSELHRDHLKLESLFCRVHCLAPSVAFLHELSRTNDTFGFLYEATVESIPPQTAMSIVRDSFTESHVRAHLILVVANSSRPRMRIHLDEVLFPDQQAQKQNELLAFLCCEQTILDMATSMCSPNLCVIAAGYRNLPVEQCWLCWIICVLSHLKSEPLVGKHNKQVVHELLERSMHGVLLLGCYIFYPSCSLRLFVNFHHEFCTKNYVTACALFERFTSCVLQEQASNTSLPWVRECIDFEVKVLFSESLRGCSKYSLQSRNPLLELLYILDKFQFDGSYSRVYRVVKLLELDCSIGVEVSTLAMFPRDVVNTMLNQVEPRFASCREFVSICANGFEGDWKNLRVRCTYIPGDTTTILNERILMRELQCLVEKHGKTAWSDMWRKCRDLVLLHNFPTHRCVHFFASCLNVYQGKVVETLEIVCLLELLEEFQKLLQPELAVTAMDISSRQAYLSFCGDRDVCLDPGTDMYNSVLARLIVMKNIAKEKATCLYDLPALKYAISSEAVEDDMSILVERLVLSRIRSDIIQLDAKASLLIAHVVDELVNEGNLSSASAICVHFSSVGVDIGPVIIADIALKLAKNKASDRRLVLQGFSGETWASLPSLEDMKASGTKSLLLQLQDIHPRIKKFLQRVLCTWRVARALSLKYDDVCALDEGYSVLGELLSKSCFGSVEWWKESRAAMMDPTTFAELLQADSFPDKKNKRAATLLQQVVELFELDFERFAEMTCSLLSCTWHDVDTTPSWTVDAFRYIFRMFGKTENVSYLARHALKIIGNYDSISNKVIVEMLVFAFSAALYSLDRECINRTLDWIKRFALQTAIEGKSELLVRVLVGTEAYDSLKFVFVLLRENQAIDLLVERVEQLPSYIARTRLKLAMSEWLDECDLDMAEMVIIYSSLGMHGEIGWLLYQKAVKLMLETSLQLKFSVDQIDVNQLFLTKQMLLQAAECFDKVDTVSSIFPIEQNNKDVSRIARAKARLVGAQVELLGKHVLLGLSDIDARILRDSRITDPLHKTIVSMAYNI